MVRRGKLRRKRAAQQRSEQRRNECILLGLDPAWLAAYEKARVRLLAHSDWATEYDRTVKKAP